MDVKVHQHTRMQGAGSVEARVATEDWMVVAVVEKARQATFAVPSDMLTYGLAYHVASRSILKARIVSDYTFKLGIGPSVRQRGEPDSAFERAMNMKCPACGAAELVHDTRDMPYTYKGETTTIQGVEGDFCPACGEAVMEMAAGVRHSAAMLAFNKEVNAAIVDPTFIIGVRKKLALDQREAAEIFGGGINAFSRYENGKTRPPLALVKLLKVLDRHPELLSEVRTA